MSEDWKATLSEDIRGDASLATIADVPSLAKGYVSAQKMIGTKRLEEPQPTWKEDQWNNFYKALGRPETPDKYTVPKVTLPEGLKLEDTRLAKAKETLHKLGLTDKQASGVLQHYFDDLGGSYKAATDARAAEKLAAENQLKAEWGDKFKAQMDMAKSVVSHFGGEDFVKYLDESGYGNDPQLTKFLAKVGAKMMEDTAAGDKGGFKVLDSTKAKQEITNLYGDKAFMAAWMSKENPGHQAAVEKMVELQRLASAEEK